MPKVTFVLPSGAECVAEVSPGASALEAARSIDLDIEGACGGAMACATCHVHLEPADFASLAPSSIEESEMLELAEELAPTSRLGCQLAIDRDLRLSVPRSSLL